MSEAKRYWIHDSLLLSTNQEFYRSVHLPHMVEVVESAGYQAIRDDNARLRQRKDGAYLERNQVVAALARCFPSGIARTAIEGWHEEWHGCVYIDLPTGQVSWHYHDSHAHLFAGLPPYQGTWDGHSTEEKYRRLAALDGGKGAQE